MAACFISLLNSMNRGQMKAVSAFGLVAELSWHALITLHLPPQTLLESPSMQPAWKSM